jgi:hypothetical protein
VGDPLSFLAALARCARPGGSVIVSVPNRLRSYRDPFEPLDCPPHHLTRWTADPLARLGARCGLKLAEFAFEPATEGTPRVLVERKAQAWLARRSALFEGRVARWALRHAMRVVVPQPLARELSRRGALDRMGIRGQAVLAHFVVSQAERD